MDSFIDITSPNVYLFHSTIPEKLITISDYDYIYHITDDFIEYIRLPIPISSAIPIPSAIPITSLSIEDTNMENKKGRVKKNRKVKPTLDLTSMKIKDLNIYIRDNNLTTEEALELKIQRRRELNCIYARNCRSNK
jgi:predicted permease